MVKGTRDGLQRLRAKKGAMVDSISSLASLIGVTPDALNGPTSAILGKVDFYSGFDSYCGSVFLTSSPSSFPPSPLKVDDKAVA